MQKAAQRKRDFLRAAFTQIKLFRRWGSLGILLRDILKPAAISLSGIYLQSPGSFRDGFYSIRSFYMADFSSVG